MKNKTSEPLAPLPTEQRLSHLEAELARHRRAGRRFRRVATAAVVALCLVLPAGAFSQVFAFPFGWHVFSAGRPARASEVNANFQWILEKIGTNPMDMEVRGNLEVGGALSSPVSALTVDDDLSVMGSIDVINVNISGIAQVGLAQVQCSVSGAAGPRSCACPAGTRVVGGGFSFPSATVLESRPDGESGWRVNRSSSVSGTMWAICGRFGN